MHNIVLSGSGCWRGKHRREITICHHKCQHLELILHFNPQTRSLCASPFSVLQAKKSMSKRSRSHVTGMLRWCTIVIAKQNCENLRHKIGFSKKHHHNLHSNSHSRILAASFCGKFKRFYWTIAIVLQTSTELGVVSTSFVLESSC